MKLKKIILSLLVITGFSAYAWYQNQNPVPSDTPTAQNAPIADPATHTQVAVAPKENPPAPTSSGGSTPKVSAPPPKTGLYKDGTYTGSSVDAFYGYVQVQAIVQGGKLTDVQFLEYPNDRGTSIQINRIATPRLAQEAISVQSANVNTVSGASETSRAFRISLASALASAKS